MFFFLPYGHDQWVYDPPWLTRSLIAVCVGMFLATSIVQAVVWPGLEEAFTEFQRVTDEYPEARFGFEVTGLPEQMEPLVLSRMDLDPNRVPHRGDTQLEAATVELVRSLNKLPIMRLGYRPAGPTPLATIGHMFTHAGIFHLLGNMLFLWLAGGVLECFWRRWAYVGLYFAAGFGALAAHHLADPTSTTPMVGASGAIAGLVGAFLVTKPTVHFKVFYFVWALVRIFVGRWLAPAWLVIPLWISGDVLSAYLGANDGVAHWAHLGGFAVGVAAATLARAFKLIAIDDGMDVDLKTMSVMEQLSPPMRPSLQPRSGGPARVPLSHYPSHMPRAPKTGFTDPPRGGRAPDEVVRDRTSAADDSARQRRPEREPQTPSDSDNSDLPLPDFD